MNIHYTFTKLSQFFVNEYLPLLNEEIASLEKKMAALEQFETVPEEEKRRVSEQIEAYKRLRFEFEEGLRLSESILSGEVSNDVTRISVIKKLEALTVLMDLTNGTSSDVTD